jgi:Nif-specific regulatory protein
VASGVDERARLQLLYELGCAFTARTDLDELIPLVMAKCREVLAAEGAAVLLLDDDENELYFPYAAEEREEVAERLRTLRFPASQGIAGAVVQTGRGVRVDDVATDSRFYRAIDRDTGLSTRCLLAAPLVARQGVVGVVQVVNRLGGGTFDDTDLVFLSALAGSIAVAIENAQLYARLRASEETLRAQVGALRRDRARRDGFEGVIATAPTMREVIRLMESAAASPITVLIEGETGTGKELVARGIHQHSVRADAPFVAINCAALPEALLESELFGHRKGAFTGAVQDQRGFFEAANGGTILLDEIGDMPPVMQAKLLRVLQEGEIVPVGDRRPRRVDVRVISATNRDLVAEVDRGTFRSDLFYRLSAFPIRLPPLRERRDDIPLLAERFLTAAAQRHGKVVVGFEPDALARLVAFDWPGNVRELQNELERAVALARAGEPIRVAHLSPKIATGGMIAAAPPTRAAVSDTIGLRAARTAFEVRHISSVLELHGGNVTRAAAALGVSRVALQKKMKEHGLR